MAAVDENRIDHSVLMRVLDHVGSRLESVKDNAASHLASPELHHSLLFFLEVILFFPPFVCGWRAQTHMSRRYIVSCRLL